MIHNHEVRGSSPRPATNEKALTVRCKCFFCARMQYVNAHFAGRSDAEDRVPASRERNAERLGTQPEYEIRRFLSAGRIQPPPRRPGVFPGVLPGAAVSFRNTRPQPLRQLSPQCLRLYVEYRSRIDRTAMLADLEMAVGARAPARAPDASDLLSGLHFISPVDEIFRIVRIHGLQAVAMTDNDRIPATGLEFRKNDGPVESGPDSGAFLRLQVDTRMSARPV